MNENTSPWPHEDDCVIVRGDTVKRYWPNGQGHDYIEFYTVSFAPGDRPQHLLGFGESPSAAVADLYRSLANHDASVS